jgi:hypothetical protein
MRDTGELVSRAELQARAYERPTVEQDEIADRDWMELAWLLRYQNPDLFIEMLTVLRAKARAHDLGAEEADALDDDEDDGKVETGDTDRGKATPVARDSDEESAI